MGKRKAGKNKAIDPACDHEPLEVSRGANGSTLWACPCGEKQWVSGAETGQKLIALEGNLKQALPRLNGYVVELEGSTVQAPPPFKQEEPAPAPGIGFTFEEAPVAELYGVPPIVHVDAGPSGNVVITGNQRQDIVQHSSKSNEHYTPPHIVEPARKLMGAIDLDPATCVKANEVVRAVDTFVLDQDGLRYPWGRFVDQAPARVFLNPPGGVVRLGKTPVSQSAIWWAKLVQEWQAGRVEQAVFVGFTLEILRNTQIGQRVPVQWFHRCYPKNRIEFLDEQGNVQDQPGHANLIVFLPPIAPKEPLVRDRTRSSCAYDWMATFRQFEEAYAHLGFCEPGWYKSGVDRP